jgi:hypothetical protein
MTLRYTPRAWGSSRPFFLYRGGPCNSSVSRAVLILQGWLSAEASRRFVPIILSPGAFRPHRGFLFALRGNLGAGRRVSSVRRPTFYPRPQSFAHGERLVTCVRKSPVRRRGFFFARAAHRKSIQAGMHGVASYTLHFFKAIAF